MTREIDPAQPVDGGRHEPGDADADRGEERLSHASILPSSFVERWAAELAAIVPPRRRALDIAIGHGRHALVLARSGFTVFGVDWRLDALRDATVRLEQSGQRLRTWCADLTVSPLPRAQFELVLVTRYLQRGLFASLKEALVPGGAIVYETFTERQLAYGRGPTSPDHLLRAGELRSYFDGFEVVFEEEVDEPEAVARIVAIKRGIQL
jgi:SAM-dependent methyltransferase